ncbi:hypothetical protein BpHYR1_019497 [Brachionus plicatilis]|uniref:Uncharacterized protein n=1 Tax=Brachionus plicatilis TaxID=10195 RepID=A0A3M7S1B7_BRAPC|nr:hypothetical protein BpHYR1_019497 [Brachionus plicatilis]
MNICRKHEKSNFLIGLVEVKSVFGKYPGQLLRICGFIHDILNDDKNLILELNSASISLSINSNTVLKSIELNRYFLNQKLLLAGYFSIDWLEFENFEHICIKFETLIFGPFCSARIGNSRKSHDPLVLVSDIINSDQHIQQIVFDGNMKCNLLKCKVDHNKLNTVNTYGCPETTAPNSFYCKNHLDHQNISVADFPPDNFIKIVSDKKTKNGMQFTVLFDKPPNKRVFDQETVEKWTIVYGDYIKYINNKMSNLD